MKIFTPSENRAIDYAASVLGINRAWLVDLIQFESRWDAAARNAATGARGLIQFMPATAAGMGFWGFDSIKKGSPTAADTLVSKYPTIETQLEQVVHYLKPMMPFPSIQSLYMAVFYPKYRSVSPDTVFPAAVQAVNPGIHSVADYLRRASPIARAALPIVLLAVGGAVFF